MLCRLVNAKKVPNDFWQEAKTVLKRHMLSLYGLYYSLKEFDWTTPMTEKPLEEELSPTKLGKLESGFSGVDNISDQETGEIDESKQGFYSKPANWTETKLFKDEKAVQYITKRAYKFLGPRMRAYLKAGRDPGELPYQLEYQLSLREEVFIILGSNLRIYFEEMERLGTPITNENLFDFSKKCLEAVMKNEDIVDLYLQVKNKLNKHRLRQARK